MLTELFPYCLSISVDQMPPDNGLPHVSLEVGIEDTKHEGLFSLNLFLQAHYLEYSWDPGPHYICGSWQL